MASARRPGRVGKGHTEGGQCSWTPALRAWPYKEPSSPRLRGLGDEQVLEPQSRGLCDRGDPSGLHCACPPLSHLSWTGGGVYTWNQPWPLAAWHGFLFGES